MLQVSYTLGSLGAEKASMYKVTEVFSGEIVGTFKSHDVLNITVNPTGVYFGMAEVITEHY